MKERKKIYKDSIHWFDSLEELCARRTDDMYPVDVEVYELVKKIKINIEIEKHIIIEKEKK